VAGWPHSTLRRDGALAVAGFTYHNLGCATISSGALGLVRAYDVGLRQKLLSNYIDPGLALLMHVTTSSNSDKREQSVTPRIGQCCSHLMWGNRLADVADRPVCGNSFSRGMRQNRLAGQGQPLHQSRWCTVALSWWLKVLAQCGGRSTATQVAD
jgi:hypothetical protein